MLVAFDSVRVLAVSVSHSVSRCHFFAEPCLHFYSTKLAGREEAARTNRLSVKKGFNQPPGPYKNNIPFRNVSCPRILGCGYMCRLWKILFLGFVAFSPSTRQFKIALFALQVNKLKCSKSLHIWCGFGPSNYKTYGERIQDPGEVRKFLITVANRENMSICERKKKHQS